MTQETVGQGGLFGQDCILELVLLLEWVCWGKRLVAENKSWLGLVRLDKQMVIWMTITQPPALALLLCSGALPVVSLVPSCSSAFILFHPHPLACSIIFLWKSTEGQILSSFLISNSRSINADGRFMHLQKVWFPCLKDRITQYITSFLLFLFQCNSYTSGH